MQGSGPSWWWEEQGLAPGWALFALTAANSPNTHVQGNTGLGRRWARAGGKLELHQSEPSTESWLPWPANNNLQRITAHPSLLGGLCQSLGLQNLTSVLQRWQSPAGNVLKDTISHGNI